MAETTWTFVPSDVAPLDIARAFGQRVAEGPIQDDMRKDPDLGSPGGFGMFVDTSTNDADDAMIVWMGLRGGLPTEKVTRMLDYRHRRGKYADLPDDSWKRPDVVVHTGLAKEYYEIKPRSPTGIDAARQKFKRIDPFVSEFKLPYGRGTQYLPQGAREKEIKIPQALQAMLNNLLSMFKLQRIRIFLEWDRPSPGMILYAFRVRVETRDKRAAKQGAMANLARFVLQLAIQTEVPGAKLVTPPKGITTVDVPPELNDFRETLRVTAGGMVFDAVPGETHFLVIEEAGFQRIIERQRQLPRFLRSAGQMFNNEEWRRILREAEAEQARNRDRLILGATVLVFAAVACYAMAPVAVAAAAVSVTSTTIATETAVTTTTLVATETTATTVTTAAAGSGTALGGADVAVGTTARSGAKVVAEWLGAAVNDNAQAIGKAAAVFVAGASYTFGSLKSAAAAESVIRTGIMMTADAAFDPTWLLRPNKTFGGAPADFGALVDVSKFGLYALTVPGESPPPARMRFIARVTFT